MEKKKKKLSPYEKLRSEAVDAFDDIFRYLFWFCKHYILCVLQKKNWYPQLYSCVNSYAFHIFLQYSKCEIISFDKYIYGYRRFVIMIIRLKLNFILYRKYLTSPKNLPLCEIFYYDSVSEVRYHLYASPRSALQTALGNPQHYLQVRWHTANMQKSRYSFQKTHHTENKVVISLVYVQNICKDIELISFICKIEHFTL